MSYYGLTENDSFAARVERELEILMDTKSAPYHVNACGKRFQTSKSRLMEMPYFHSMLNGIWKEGSDVTLGSLDNPVFVNIPPKQFELTLKQLRLRLQEKKLKTLSTDDFWSPNSAILQQNISIRSIQTLILSFCLTFYLVCCLKFQACSQHVYLKCEAPGFGKKVSIEIPHCLGTCKKMRPTPLKRGVPTQKIYG
jgi:hypothetical protein